MKRLLPLAILLPCAAFAQSPNQIDDLAAKAMRRYRVPGMAVVVVKDGKVLFAKGYGVKELGKPDKVTEHTLFQIASNTKSFTAAALALLVEEGKVKWDESVITCLPDFAMYDPWVTKQITVRDLLVHRSGLPAGGGDILYLPESDYSRKEIVAKVRLIKPQASFRSTDAYVNVMYGVAGELIEKVSGMTWEEFVDSRIVKKLGMTETRVRFSDFARSPDHALPYADVEGRLTAVVPYADDPIDPAGGISSNAVDLGKWLLTRLQDGKGLLKKESERELTTLVTPFPDPTVPFSGYTPGMEVRSYEGHKLLEHSGGAPGMASRFMLLPEKKLGIFVLTNYWTGADLRVPLAIVDLALGLKKSESIQLLNKREVVPPAAYSESKLAPLPPIAELARYVGEYEDVVYGRADVKLEGERLVVRFSRTTSLVGDVVGKLDGRYYVRWRNRSLLSDATLAFEEEAGKVKRLAMQNASMVPGTMINFSLLDFVKKNE